MNREFLPSSHLFHLREELLAPSDLILPGRWGTTVLRTGGNHSHYFRELLLEHYRRTLTEIPVSRLSCTYAWADEDHALRWADEEPDQHLYLVVPTDAQGPSGLFDALWLVWMAEPNHSYEKVLKQCGHYWAGESTKDHISRAKPAWEWLFGSSLQVVERLR